jgi:hypothetical protein
MSTTTDIGAISVSLRAGGVASFSSDIDKAFAKAKDSAKDFKSAMQREVKESNASLALLGEELGVRLPRHLRGFVSQLPGVSKAMSAAFAGVAVIAIAEVLVKAAEKAYELAKAFDISGEAAKKNADAWKTLQTSQLRSNEQIELTNAKLDVEIAKLEHKPVNNLKVALLEAQIAAGSLYEKLHKANLESIKLLKDSQPNWFIRLLSGGAAQTNTGVTDILEGANSATVGGHDVGMPKQDPLKEQRNNIDVTITRLKTLQQSWKDANQAAITSPSAGSPVYSESQLDALQQEIYQKQAQRRGIDDEIANSEKRATVNSQTALNENRSALEKLAEQYREFRLAMAAAVDKMSIKPESNDFVAKARELQAKATAEINKAFEKEAENLNKVHASTAQVTADREKAIASVNRMTDALIQHNAQLAIEETHASILKLAGIETTPKQDTRAEMAVGISNIINPNFVPAMPKLVGTTQEQEIAKFNNNLKEQAALLSKVDVAVLTTQEKLNVYAAELQSLGNKGEISWEQQTKALQVYAEELEKTEKRHMNSVSGFFNTFVDQSRQYGKEAAQTLDQAFSGFNDNLTKMLLGQKTSWKSLFDSLAGSTMKIGLKGIEGNLISKIPGMGGLKMPQMIQASTVTVTAASVNVGGGPTGGSGAGGLAGLFGDGGAGGGLTSGFSSIGDFGAAAGGGDIDPYGMTLVGEKGPELLTGMAGHVHSNADTKKMLGGGDTHNYNYTIDARDTNPADTEMRVRKAIKESHMTAVQQSLSAHKEMQSRRPASSSGR